MATPDPTVPAGSLDAASDWSVATTTGDWLASLPAREWLPAAALGADAGTAVALLGALTAVVGLFVGYQAFRGYRRNDSRPMLLLAAGVVLLTAVPYALSSAIGALTAAGDATVLLVVAACNVCGLAAILRSLRPG